VAHGRRRQRPRTTPGQPPWSDQWAPWTLNATGGPRGRPAEGLRRQPPDKPGADRPLPGCWAVQTALNGPFRDIAPVTLAGGPQGRGHYLPRPEPSTTPLMQAYPAGPGLNPVCRARRSAPGCWETDAPTPRRSEWSSPRPNGGGRRQTSSRSTGGLGRPTRVRQSGPASSTLPTGAAGPISRLPAMSRVDHG